MNVGGNGVKCPICGESKHIKPMGRVNVIGLDPLMEKFTCENLCLQKQQESVSGYPPPQYKLCNTEFYVAPLPTKRIEEKKE